MAETKKDLTEQLDEVNHAIDNLSPNLEPSDYLRRQKDLNIKKTKLEEKIAGKKKPESKIDVTYVPDMNVDPFFKDYDVSVELKSKNNNKKKKTLKMISSFSILFIIIAVLILISWILNGAKVGTTWHGDIDNIQNWIKENSGSFTWNNGVLPAFPTTGKVGDIIATGVANKTIWADDNIIVRKNDTLEIFISNITKTGDIEFGTKISGLVQPLGVLEIFESAFYGFANKVDVITFVLVIGGFITVVMSSKALEGFSQNITKNLKGKEIWALPPLMFFFSICGTVEGFSEESLGFYLLLIPVMIMCGFDVFTGVIAILLGAGIGVLTSIVNPFVISIAISSMNDGLANTSKEISMGDGIAWRVITWFLFTTIAVAVTMMYANKVKKNPSKSITFATYEGDKTYFLGGADEKIEMTWKRKLTLGFFFFTFVVMIVYLINWDALGGDGKTLQNAGRWMNENIPWLTHNMPGIGYGGFIVPSTIFLISAIVCGLVNGIGEHDFIKSFMTGATDMLSVCLIIGVAGGVTWVLKQSHLQDLFVSGLGKIQAPSVVKPIILFLIFIPLSFLIPSSTGFATAIFPLLGGMVQQNGAVDMVAATGAIQAFSFGAGLVMLFSPTNGVVMGAIGIARMDYKTFLKGIMPIVGIFFVLSIAFLALGGGIATWSGLPAFGGPAL